MVPAGGGMMMQGGAPGAMAAGPIGTVRNATTITLVSILLSMCGGVYYGLFQCMKVEEELNRFLGKGSGGSILWLLFPLIPALSAGKLIGEARQKAGTPTQGDGSLIMYILLPYYSFVNDANEVWTAAGVKPAA